MSYTVDFKGGHVIYMYCSNIVALLPLLVKVTTVVTFNPLPILPCNSYITITSYSYFKCNKIITSYYKK